MVIGIDSHCHLDCFQNVQEIVDQAQKNGIEKVMTIGTELDDFARLSEICKSFPGKVGMTLGIHPDYISSVTEAMLDVYFKNLKAPYVFGVGEIGLDYHKKPEKKEMDQQKRIFEYQVALAGQYGVPVCVHARDCGEDALDIVLDFKGQSGVFHCFAGDLDCARRALDGGWALSVSGIVTFKNAAVLRDVVRFTPLERLLIETDSPYLAPVPHRGQRNEPAWVRFVADCVAELKGISVEDVLRQTTENFFKEFPKAQSLWRSETGKITKNGTNSV